MTHFRVSLNSITKLCVTRPNLTFVQSQYPFRSFVCTVSCLVFYPQLGLVFCPQVQYHIMSGLLSKVTVSYLVFCPQLQCPVWSFVHSCGMRSGRLSTVAISCLVFGGVVAHSEYDKSQKYTVQVITYSLVFKIKLDVKKY